MRHPSIYVKMKVLGAIDVVEGKSRQQRIRKVAEMTFLDEEGNPYLLRAELQSQNCSNWNCRDLGSDWASCSN